MLNCIFTKPQVQAICMCVIFTHCVLPCTLKCELRGRTNDLALSLPLSPSLSLSFPLTHTHTHTYTHTHLHTGSLMRLNAPSGRTATAISAPLAQAVSRNTPAATSTANVAFKVTVENRCVF
jgi:Cdc6-like AAA superfamily ATPase